MANKRIRVASSTSGTEKRTAIPPRRVVASDNPSVGKSLTKNEIQARINRRYATSTSLGGFRNAALNVLDSSQGSFYSPQLSTDFLEKPQNLRERRAFYRFFYNTNEIVGQAIDVHSTLPLSKLRLIPPKGNNPKQCEYVFKFFERMCDEMKLFRTLIEATHEFFLMGNCFLFAEEDDSFDGLSEEEKELKREEAKKKCLYLEKKYKITDKNPLYSGWKRLIILPPDQVRIRKLPLSDNIAVEYVPDPETRKFLSEGFITSNPDTPSSERNYKIPLSIQDKLRSSGVIPIDTDPYSGSYVYHLARKKSQYEPLGVSIIERCINTLVLLDKLRQAQTSIASRHMTPMRIVWAEDLNPEDIENLREQVDLALVDPDFSIIANYEVHWQEMGSNGRLLDIGGENEMGINRLMVGLGLTKEILTGEGSFSGSKISLEIMNTQYLLYREIVQDYVENYLFKPVAKKKGFIEYDEFGNEIVLYPKLSFTRLAIRDNERFFDAAFQLYQKGSISIDLILDILNVDPVGTREKIEKDLFTVNDSLFNEVLRNIYSNISGPLVEQTDIVKRMADYLRLKMLPPQEEPETNSRFSSDKNGESRKEKLMKVMKYLQDNPDVLDRMLK